MRRTAILALTTALLVVAFPSAARATGGEGEAWPSFNESSACGALRIITPHAPESGTLPITTYLRGEFASYFGRTVGDVRTQLVAWRIPGSSKSLAVHPYIIPALERAANQLDLALENEASYDIDGRSTFSTASRTIRGGVRISRHAFGIAFDVNSVRNPYRDDNQLITDLPDWWVDALTDAGFCWGGRWIGSKDAMHFAWQGPAFSGYDHLPEPAPPVTERAALGSPDATFFVVPRAMAGTVVTSLTDVDGNGARDVVRVVVDGENVIVDASVASRRHNACSARRSLVSGLGDTARDAVAVGFGDWDGRGGQDLWMISDDGGRARLTVRWAYGGYAAETEAITTIPAPSSDAWVSTADADADGALDLFVAEDGLVTVYSVDPDTGAAEQIIEVTDPFPGADQRFIGDEDLDRRPDLWAIVDGKVRMAHASDGYRLSPLTHVPLKLASDLEDAAAADYDGDGRVDLITYDGFVKRVWLANDRLPDDLPLEVWFEHPEPECGEGEATWQRDEVRFSTSGWIARGSHEWRALNDLPAGCDPEEASCRIDPVTARTLAEFFAWIDGLGPGSAATSLAGPRAVLDAGYQLPCTDGHHDCWDAPMLRSDVAGYFGMFLSDRHGAVPSPHRWVVTPAPEVDPDRLPR